MSCTPLGGLLWLRSTKRASAGGQLEHPSEVNNSMTTGVSAQELETWPTTRAMIANSRRTDFFMLHHRTREPAGSCKRTGGRASRQSPAALEPAAFSA